MNNSVLFIVPAAHVVVANKLYEICGLGPNCFSVRVSSTGADPAEFFYGNYEAMPPAEEALVRSLRDALPVLDFDVWGEDGLPTEQDAEAAAAAIGFFIRDDPRMTAQEHEAAVLAGLGLEKVKDE